MGKATYNLSSKFNIQEHKKKYINYLEILILENGEIVYATPSHQLKAQDLACKKLGLSTKQLGKLCPKEYFFNYLTWLLNLINAVSVWDNFCQISENGANKRQISVLKNLKLNGLYSGVIPKIKELF